MRIYFENEEERQEFLEAIADSELCPRLFAQEDCCGFCENCWKNALDTMSEILEDQEMCEEPEEELEENIISDFSGEYAFLSNAYNADILYDGLLYKNAESAYQAQKITCENLRKVFTETSASEARELGRQLVLRNDWDQVLAMKSVVYEKFYQNPEIRTLLLNAKDAILAAEGIGTFWGVKDGKGKNLLGMILMNVRDELSSKEFPEEEQNNKSNEDSNANENPLLLVLNGFVNALQSAFGSPEELKNLPEPLRELFEYCQKSK